MVKTGHGFLAGSPWLAFEWRVWVTLPGRRVAALLPPASALQAQVAAAGAGLQRDAGTGVAAEPLPRSRGSL